jgi:hypothetical protein
MTQPGIAGADITGADVAGADAASGSSPGSVASGFSRKDSTSRENK